MWAGVEGFGRWSKPTPHLSIRGIREKMRALCKRDPRIFSMSINLLTEASRTSFSPDLLGVLRDFFLANSTVIMPLSIRYLGHFWPSSTDGWWRTHRPHSPLRKQGLLRSGPMGGAPILARSPGRLAGVARILPPPTSRA